MNSRIAIPKDVIQRVLEGVHRDLQQAIRVKGDGSFISMEEIRGAIDEEVDEMHEAIHDGDVAALRAELTDVVIGGLWGLASLEAWQ